MTRQECLQEIYEEVLGSHWRQLHQIKELVETSTGSQLRRMSISTRRDELSRIENQLDVLGQLSEEFLQIPEWYTNKIKQLSTI